MKSIIGIVVFSVILLAQTSLAQQLKTDANIIGHVAHNDKHIPFATVGLKGTTVGTITDETGHYQLINLPTGEQTLTVSMVGYKPQSQIVNLQANETIEIKFDLEEDVLNLEAVVVSADRAETKRKDAPVIVNTISANIFNSSQSLVLGEGLNFSPGLRLENNCQNCGFTQVRMNGMEGPYSQILINNRPIFSGLASVYGLELIPSNMIEQIEVVRGGGSALYGGNAIAGTVNIIMKTPKINSFEAGSTYAMTGVGVDGSGGAAPDYSINFNASLVTDDLNSGLSLYGFTRNRAMFDANNDGFSEIAPLGNTTFGARFFHNFSYRDKLSLDFFNINEQRDGGDLQDYPEHQRNIGEVLGHRMNVAAITYERFFRDADKLSIYASGQLLNRDSYYGAEFSLSDYGNTRDNTYNLGIQYHALMRNATLVTGIENTGGFLLDKKLGDPIFGTNEDGEIIIVGNNPHTIVSDQSSITTGIFGQYDVDINKFKLSLGARVDNYNITNKAHDDEANTGTVFSPRASLMYEIAKDVQGRVSYSQGYRAPQIFDEDLHIETSGSRQVFHVNDPDLRQETSHSIMASVDMNKLVGTVYTGLLIEGFHTQLVDAFINEYGEPDEDGRVIYTRTNSEGGATVQGINIELRLKPLQKFEWTSGYTMQTSVYEESQEDFDEEHFFRTPNHYGYFILDWDFVKNLCFSATGNYTGSMLVPYFGTSAPEGELRTSKPFYDMGVKFAYTIQLKGIGLELSSGVRNIFNSYQSDFDSGIERDPAYVYGPVTPRTVYLGLKIGNLVGK